MHAYRQTTSRFESFLLKKIFSIGNLNFSAIINISLDLNSQNPFSLFLYEFSLTPINSAMSSCVIFFDFLSS